MTIALSIASVFAVLACHWLGLFLIRGQFNFCLSRLGQHGNWGSDFSLALTILLLVVLNFVDVTACAAILLTQDSGLGYSDAFLFAIGNFTTVGAKPPDDLPLWPLAGPLIGMCGIFIFGWTTSFLVACTHTTRDDAKARQDEARERRHDHETVKL